MKRMAFITAIVTLSHCQTITLSHYHTITVTLSLSHYHYHTATLSHYHLIAIADITLAQDNTKLNP
jgi:hypothetical protein